MQVVNGAYSAYAAWGLHMQYATSVYLFENKCNILNAMIRTKMIVILFWDNIITMIEILFLYLMPNSSSCNMVNI